MDPFVPVVGWVFVGRYIGGIWCRLQCPSGIHGGFRLLEILQYCICLCSLEGREGLLHEFWLSCSVKRTTQNKITSMLDV